MADLPARTSRPCGQTTDLNVKSLKSFKRNGPLEMSKSSLKPQTRASSPNQCSRIQLEREFCLCCSSLREIVTHYHQFTTELIK